LNAEAEQWVWFQSQKPFQDGRRGDSDLVQVGTDSRPIVCKIMDYGKKIFRREKATRRCQEETKDRRNVKDLSSVQN